MILATMEWFGGEILIEHTRAGYHWTCSCGDGEEDFPDQATAEWHAWDHLKFLHKA